MRQRTQTKTSLPPVQRQATDRPHRSAGYLAAVLHSTAFRVAAGYTLLFAASVLVIFAITYTEASREMRQILRAKVDSETHSLATVYQEAGLGTLASTIDGRSAANLQADQFYLLIDRDDRKLAGNLDPPDAFIGWREWTRYGSLPSIAPEIADPEFKVIGYGLNLGPARLIVAASANAMEETQEVLLASFAWGIVATVLIGLAGGIALSRGPIRRIDRIAEAMRQVVAGHLTERIPTHGSQDELDRLSADINVMLDRIQDLMESLKQVSNDIAHDLRTPLSRLRQRLDQALRLAEPRPSVTVAKEQIEGRDGQKEEAIDPVDAGYRRALEQAIADTDTIISAFNALLRIAQIEAGARRAKFTKVDLTAILQNVAEVYESVAEEFGHCFSCDLADAVMVFGDHDLLTQLFANLVDNAITHMPPGGRIDLQLRLVDGAAICELRDSGPGIPAAERGNVFRRLYRLEHSRTTPGNGLGLSLVAAIGDLHGANIELGDNQPGLVVKVSFRAGIGH